MRRMNSSDSPPAETAPTWPVTNPFVTRRAVVASEIDGFGHMNNVRYADWAMEAAWAHSAAVGVDFTDYERLGAGFVVQRHEFDYLAPALLNEEILVATWIAVNDGRVRVRRAYEMRRASDGTPIFRGESRMVCVDMQTGRPVRMPAELAAAYTPAAAR